MRKLLFISALLLAILLAPAMVFATEGESRVILDGADIGVAAGNMLPLRAVVTRAGGTVAWNNNARQVNIRRGNHTVDITIGNTQATVGGRAVNLSAPPVIIGGQTFVPLCLLANHLGLGAGHINNRFILSTSPAQRIPIVVYHHILPDEVNTRFLDNPWTISTEDFTTHMRYLRDNGFYTPTLDELEGFLFHGRQLPANSVMIHFDDGYYSNYVYAYPILQHYGLRAVLFPITRQAQELGDFQPPICHNSLTRASASTLLAPSHVFETASHSHNLHRHVPGTEVSVLVRATHEEIVQDTLQSFEFVHNHRAYAFPFGQFNNTAVNALEEAGITMAFTTRHGYVTPNSDPMRLNRFSVYRTMSMTRFRNIVNRRA